MERAQAEIRKPAESRSEGGSASSCVGDEHKLRSRLVEARSSQQDKHQGPHVGGRWGGGEETRMWMWMGDGKEQPHNRTTAPLRRTYLHVPTYRRGQRGAHRTSLPRECMEFGDARSSMKSRVSTG